MQSTQTHLRLLCAGVLIDAMWADIDVKQQLIHFKRTCLQKSVWDLLHKFVLCDRRNPIAVKKTHARSILNKVIKLQHTANARVYEHQHTQSLQMVTQMQAKIAEATEAMEAMQAAGTMQAIQVEEARQLVQELLIVLADMGQKLDDTASYLGDIDSAMATENMHLFDSESDVAGKYALFMNRVMVAAGQTVKLQYIVFCHNYGVGLSVLRGENYDISFFAESGMQGTAFVYNESNDIDRQAHVDYIRNQLQLAT